MFKKLSSIFMGKQAPTASARADLLLEESEGHLGGYVIGCPAPGTWCPRLWEWFVRRQGVTSVLDIGCGLGYAIEYFQGLGCAVLGVDGSPSAIANNRLPARVARHDFESGPFRGAVAGFDLVWSAEFVEHVEERFAENYLVAFDLAQRFLCITYAVPGQGGHHHVNEQPEEYWVSLLECRGFVLDAEMTAVARALMPETGLEGMQFRDKGLVFRRP